MIEKLTYNHEPEILMESIDIEIWVKDGKLYYNKNDLLVNLEPDDYAENVESSLSVEEFEKKLAKLKIEDWDDVSLPPEDVVYLDGSNWTVKVKYEGKKAIKKTGENAYPAN